MIFFGYNLSSVNSLEWISISNQECKVGPEIVNVNSKGPVFFPFSIKTSKCSGNCNNIIDPYAKVCVPDVVRLDASACNNKQRWNEDKCMCECKELIDKGLCDKGFIWNPSNCECECDKSCDIGEYLNYSNCKCMKQLIDKLIEECTENIEEINLVETSTKNEHKCISCTLYTVLFWILFILSVINIEIGIYFTYYKYMSLDKQNLKNDDTHQTTIY